MAREYLTSDGPPTRVLATLASGQGREPAISHPHLPPGVHTPDPPGPGAALRSISFLPSHRSCRIARDRGRSCVQQFRRRSPHSRPLPGSSQIAAVPGTVSGRDEQDLPASGSDKRPPDLAHCHRSCRGPVPPGAEAPAGSATGNRATVHRGFWSGRKCGFARPETAIREQGIKSSAADATVPVTWLVRTDDHGN